MLKSLNGILFALVALLFVLQPQAVEAQTGEFPPEGTPIAEIRVEGIRRLTPQQVLRRMDLREGGSFTRDAFRRDRQSIYELRVIEPFGYDLLWEMNDNNELIITVQIQETPVIASIQIAGNVRYKRNQLLSQLGYDVGDLSWKDVREATTRNLRSFYSQGGFKRIEIDVQTRPALGEENAIDIIITIDEGERIKIEKVILNGNEGHSDFYYRMRLTNAPGVFFFDNYFDKDALDDDRALIRTSYEDKGYLDAVVTQGDLIYDEDKGNITIVFDITAGPRYRVTTVDAEGVSLFTPDEINQITRNMEDRLFSGNRLSKSMDRLRRLYGNEGYIDTEIGYRLDKNPEEGTVRIVFEVTEKPVVYVGQVRLQMDEQNYEVDINAFQRFIDAFAPPTKNETVMKEVRLTPGEKYRTSAEIRTIERLRNLGIFRKTEVVRVPTADPQVRDAVVVVEEDPAAAFIGATAGVGELSGPSVSFQLVQPNMGGNADRFVASATFGTRNSAFRIGYFDRYLGDTQTSLDTNIYHATDRYREYREKTTGGSTEFGRPLSEHLTGFMRFRLERVQYDRVEGDPRESFDDYWVAAVRPSVIYDRRDNIIFPTRGYMVAGGIETGVADGFLFKILHSYEWYTQPLDRSDLVYAYRHTVGLMPYDAREVGLGERFFVGGSSTLRGFKAREVGPRDPDNEDLAIGGSTRITQRHELRYPFNDFITGRVFTDAAILERGAFSLGTPRASTGVGAILKLGPVNVEVDFAIPVLKESSDERQFFHLRLGSNI